MKKYKNSSGESGVVAYEIKKDGIVIRFVDGRDYIYTFKSAGEKAIRKMWTLAESGRGLSTYISQHVKDKYAGKSE